MSGLADRIKDLSQDGDVPEDQLERAKASKQTLQERMEALGNTIDEELESDPGLAAKLDRLLQEQAANPEAPEPGKDSASAPELDEYAVQYESDETVAEDEPESADWGWFFGRKKESGLEHKPLIVIPKVPKGWTEVEFRTIEAPVSYVRIIQNDETGEYRYLVIEPQLTKREQRILDFVLDTLSRGLNRDPGPLNQQERGEFLSEVSRQIIKNYRIFAGKRTMQRIEYYVRRDFIGMGTIHVLMLDPEIEDISCDGHEEPLFVFHRKLEAMPTNVQFPSAGNLDGYVIRIAQRSGKSISISEPVLDAALPDGSRLQATLGKEVTENGSTFTIRRFKPDPFTPIDLVKFGTMSPELLAYFWMIVEYGLSLIFSGGTASGKTTGLNALGQFIPRSAKVVTIEDTREINIPHNNWIRAVTRSGTGATGQGEIGMFDLLKASLRQRPEYIIVGEVRGIEASVAFQAMATGHTVYTTMHADSARSVVYRLENEPINIPRLVLQSLDVIAIQAQTRFQGKRVRRVKEVVELVGMDPQTRELLTHTSFTWNADKDTFRYAGRSYHL